MRTDPKELQILLLTHWDLLQRSLMSLEQSTNKTRHLLQQSEFSFEELGLEQLRSFDKSRNFSDLEN